VTTPARLLLVVLLALALPATAQVYKWVDKDGKVHYSDKKPRDPKAKDVKDMGIESKPTDESAVAAEQEALKMRGVTVDGEIAERKRGEAQLAAKKAESEDRERRCANAKADLNVLTRVNTLVGVDANNKETYATGPQLEAKRAQARARVAELCD
jgi:hypothetical protein